MYLVFGGDSFEFSPSAYVCHTMPACWPSLQDDPAEVFRIPVTKYGHADFHPHGMHVEQHESGDVVATVINHRRDGDAVSMFKVVFDDEGRPVEFQHVHDVVSPLFKQLNDVVTVGPNSFFATNWLNEEVSLGFYSRFLTLSIHCIDPAPYRATLH